MHLSEHSAKDLFVLFHQFISVPEASHSVSFQFFKIYILYSIWLLNTSQFMCLQLNKRNSVHLTLGKYWLLWAC